MKRLNGYGRQKSRCARNTGGVSAFSRPAMLQLIPRTALFLALRDAMMHVKASSHQEKDGLGEEFEDCRERVDERRQRIAYHEAGHAMILSSWDTPFNDRK